MKLFALSVFALVFALGIQPLRADDFGDAPDGGPTGYPGLYAQTGNFPTLAASNGARAADLTLATLGPSASDETDARFPDDDDGVSDFVVQLTSIPPVARMTVNVNGPAGSAGGTFWINVLIDMDMDGEWDADPLAPGVTEWAVRNFPVVVTPGSSQDIVLPGFAYANGNRLPDGAWMRVLLTPNMINAPDFNGAGSFAAGEVEDHVLDLPALGSPPKRFIPIMQCNRIERFPAGAGMIPFSCMIYNFGRDPGTARYILTRVNGGVNVAPVNLPPADCAPAGPAALNCAPTPVIAPAPLGLFAPGLTPGFRADFTATRGALPSRWTYRGMGEDPPAKITPEGVIIGYGDSTGDIDFVSEAPQKQIEQKPETEDQMKK